MKYEVILKLAEKLEEQTKGNKMGRYEKRPTIRNNLGNHVRITFQHRDPLTEGLPGGEVFNYDETYEGVLRVFRHRIAPEDRGPKNFYPQDSFVGSVDGDDGIRFEFLPLDGPLHATNKHEGQNGYWWIEILDEQ